MSSSAIRFKPIRWPWIFGAVVALRFLSLIPSVIDEDEAWFSASAISLKNPFLYFQHAIDNKPPGTVFFYWLCGGDLRLTRGIFIALFALSAWMLGRIARTYSKKEDAQWIAATLLMIASVIPSFELFSVTNEGLLLIFSIFGFALLCPGVFRRFRFSEILSALCFGICLLIKPTAVFFLFPLLALTSLRKSSALKIGGYLALVLALPIWVVWKIGFHDFIYWTLTYPSQVLVPAREKLFLSRVLFVGNSLRFGFILLPLLFAAATVRKSRDNPLHGFFLAWFLSGMASIVIGSGVFLHYFLLLLPPLCIWALELPSMGRRWLGVLYLVSIAVISIPYATSFWGVDSLYHDMLSARIRSAVNSTDRIFIWGGSAIPLALSKRDHATAWINSRFLVEPYSTPEILSAFSKDLVQDPPDLVLDLSERGDNRFNFPISNNGDLQKLLESYTRAEDPSLPWTHFYFRSGISLPSGMVTTPRHFSGSDYAWNEARRLVSGRRWSEFWREERHIRARWAEIDSGIAGGPESYSLRSPFSWVGLSIVRLQPVAFRNTSVSSP